MLFLSNEDDKIRPNMMRSPVGFAQSTSQLVRRAAGLDNKLRLIKSLSELGRSSSKFTKEAMMAKLTFTAVDKILNTQKPKTLKSESSRPECYVGEFLLTDASEEMTVKKIDRKCPAIHHKIAPSLPHRKRDCSLSDIFRMRDRIGRPWMPRFPIQSFPIFLSDQPDEPCRFLLHSSLLLGEKTKAVWLDASIDSERFAACITASPPQLPFKLADSGTSLRVTLCCDKVLDLILFSRNKAHLFCSYVKELSILENRCLIPHAF